LKGERGDNPILFRRKLQNCPELGDMGIGGGIRGDLMKVVVLAVTSFFKQ